MGILSGRQRRKEKGMASPLDLGLIPGTVLRASEISAAIFTTEVNSAALAVTQLMGKATQRRSLRNVDPARLAPTIPAF